METTTHTNEVIWATGGIKNLARRWPILMALYPFAFAIDFLLELLGMAAAAAVGILVFAVMVILPLAALIWLVKMIWGVV